MFLPLFIAILLGLVSPSDCNTNQHSNTPVSVSSDEGPGDDGTGIDNPPAPGDDTGGEGAHIPPRKP